MLPVGQQQEPLNAQTVGNMLYGMQGMSSDVPEVRSVLEVCFLHYAAKEQLRNQNVTMLFMGYQV
jgi:hypothetical protein